MTPPAGPSSRQAEKKKIFLVEDHPVTLEGLTQIINYQPDLVVCGNAATAAEALRKIPQLRPDLVITDLTLHAGNGIDLIKDLVHHHPSIPVMVLSMHDEKIYAGRALRSGARGYVMKSEHGAHLLKQIRGVLAGGISVSDAMRSTLLGQMTGGVSVAADGIARLSDRELEVFRLLGEGRNTAEIAATLGIGVSTVETHRAGIKDKLGLAHATDLIAAAARWNIDRT